MYSIFETIVGIPLTQRHFGDEEDFLDELALLVREGFDLDSIHNVEQSEVSAQAWEFIQWLVSQRPSLKALKVRLATSYSGDGEPPVWLGVHVDMPSHSAFEAQRLSARWASEHDVQKLKALQALFFTAPDPYQQVLLNNLDYWSMHGTS